MKPWTEARNNKYMKYHSKLTYQLSFWNVSRKVDYHAGGKWSNHGPKRHKENQFLSLKPPCWLSLAVREIIKSSSTFSATNISSNIVWLLQLHDTIQTKSYFGTKFCSIYLAKWEKTLVFRLSFVNLRAKDETHMLNVKYRYVFVV